MLKTISIILIIFIFTLGCQNNSSVNDNKKISDELKNFDSDSNLNGYWILSEYLDSILVDKSIAKNRNHRISWSMFAFNIKNDSLRALGLIYPKSNFKIKQNNDTILSISDFGEYYLYEDKISGNILANQIKPYEAELLSKRTFHYRRVRESSLLALLDEINVIKIQNGLEQMFVDSLIVGEYKEINNRKFGKIIFSSNGKISGFKNFNKYHIHSYFGTYHPYHNNDEIFLESDNDKEHYCWQFYGDTLKLTELLTRNGDEYYKGNKSYLFKKTGKHSQ